MASGGGFPRLKQSKSETKQRSNWQRSVSSDKDDSLSLTSFPSDIRINNWDLSDLRPSASADSRRRKKSKGNPEREREQSLSMDSPPHGEQKQRTPSSLSRTRNTPVAQRDALEKLKTKLTYDDDYSTDGERNNERALPRGRRRLANNSQPEGAIGGVASGGSGGRRQTRTNRNNNTESGPDSNQIVGRLVQIRDYIKQASSMMETLQKSGDSGNAEDLAKVARLISNLREQEQGYLGLLHSSIAMRGDGAESAGSDVPVRDGVDKGDSDSEESVNVEVESDASESTNTSSSRPRIEDKLGLDSEDEKGSENSKEEDTAMDNTMVASTSVAQAMAARSVAETLNSLTQEREEPVGATGGGDVLSSQQRQQLMKIMMEKQEQLRKLQSRQDELLRMKCEAEQKLQEAQARDNQARAALAAVEAGQAVLAEESAFLDQIDGPLKSNIVGYPESDDDEASNARETDALAELQRQLNYLRNEFSVVPESGPRNNTDSSGATGRGSSSGDGAAASTQGQRQQLEDKLQDLQQKKRSMDQLLQQLQTLRSQGLQGLNNAPPPRPQQPPQQLQRRQQQQPPRRQPPPPPALEHDLSAALASLPNLAMSGIGAVAGGSGGGRRDEGGLAGFRMAEQGDANPLMSVVEAQEKLQKLQEVRQRLNQLRDLVQYYQKMKTQVEPQTMEQDEESAVAEEQGAQSGSEAPRPADMAVGGAGGFMQIQGSQLTEPSEEPSDEDNASASGTEDLESGIGAWDQDPEVQEKIKKLMKAKDKLRNLQGLIADIEALPDREKDLEDLQKARNALRQHGMAARGSETRLQDSGAGEGANMSSVSEGEVVPGMPLEGEGAAGPDGSLQQQMQELVRLREERQRLLALQAQLESLQDRFPEEERASDTETRTETSSVMRKGDGDQPTASVVTFASNDELYSKMRDQRIQREELRSKKKELEAIMKKDQNRRQYFRNQDNQSDTVSYTTGTDAFGANASADATMATWGGSTVDNLENITEDEDGQDGAAPGDDEDDGYPSDGIVQVEEEEEEADETDNATYTIDADARQRRQARFVPPPQGQGARPKTARGRRGFPQPVRPTSAKKTSKKPQSQPWGRVTREERAQNRQTSLPVLQNASVDGDSANLNPLQQFQQQLERMSALCQNMMRTPNAPSGSRPLRQSNSQLASFSLAESASSPASELQAQMMREMQQQQLMLAVSQCNQQLMMQQFDMQALHRQIQQLSGQMNAIQQNSAAPALMPTQSSADQRGQPPVFGSQPQVIAAPYLSPLSSTLAAHVPNVATSVNVQSSRQTTFTVNPTFSGAFPADPQRFPVSQAVQTNGFESQNEISSQRRQLESESQSSFPRPMQLWEDAGDESGRGQEEVPVPRMNLQAFLKARRKKSAKKRSTDKSPQAQTDWQRPSSDRPDRQSHYRPGLSAGISGSGFNDGASMSSAMSGAVEGAMGGQDIQGRAGNLNLFEELRETIYDEVASLITQNEARPQFLINLFRELQSLTTDLMRQQAIFAIQEVVASFLIKDDQEASQEAWRPWKAVPDGTSELTPSESLVTSDDDEVKARVRQHAKALERRKQKGRGIMRGNSLKNNKFDYVENAADTSSVSTPTNEVGESPFSRDSLGETVIHLDKALAKMRREMQQADQERAERVRDAMESRPEASGDFGGGDQGSESSVSDMPYPRIDAQELDQQIKGVMGQVIPVIKEHINDVCSPQLLAYIQRLVLSLVHQPGHAQEFARSIYGQLASILHDCLSKFEGRRVRECGEDLLLDMSEVLFNELAFLRLMKDLDDPSAMERMRSKSWFSPTSKSTQAGMVGEEYDAAGNESDNEASDDKDDDITPQDLRVNGVDDEEEELGKDRDDEMAQKTAPEGEEDKEEDTEDPLPTSEVHIQLAMSETKPFTRIGSDEDTDGSDESLSLEDPSDTAVSRNEMMEHQQNDLRSSAAASTSTTSTVTTSPTSAAQPKEAVMAEKEEKEADTSEADGTLEASGTADGSRGNITTGAAANGAEASMAAGSDGSEAVTGEDGEAASEVKDAGGVQVNGEVGGAEEEVPVGMDDLPPVLNVTDPEGLEQRRQQEEAGVAGVGGILNSMDTGEELVGDGSALKEPGS